jgi:glycerol dehydrogenase-like iron-containing ADH family enzyme
LGDILCYHTAHYDWKLASDLGRVEARWPYDAELVQSARKRLDLVLDQLDEIHKVSDQGVYTLMSAHRFGGATFHDSGWNPRHIEGVEHFFFYNLERLTGRHFIHGQPVGLGVLIGALWQDNEPERMLAALHRVEVDIRPQAMGVTWEEVAKAILTLPTFSRATGLWFTVADVQVPDDALVEKVRAMVEEAYGPWEGP